ncbi:MAG: MFS transporter [Anaerolineaceae bacterium]|jgi:MFS family permease
MRRVSGWYLFVLNAYWIGLSFMWNSLHVTILPAVLLNYVPENQKNTWLGLLTFFGLILAMVIQPLSGALSDLWASKMGRRRPFIWFGTLGDMIFLGIMAFVGGLPALFIGYIGLQITSNIAHGPTQGLLPDEVPTEQLGAASGIKTAMDMFGIIISSLLMGFLITAKNADPTKSVLAIIGFMVLFGGITLLGSHEKAQTPPQQNQLLLIKGLWKKVFNFSAEGDKSYWRLIFSRFLYLVGIYGFQSFAQYFIRDKFPQENPIVFTQLVMGTFVVVLIIFTLLAGFLGDRYGRKRIHIISGYIGALGAILLIFAATPIELILYGSVMGMGLGIFMSTNWAMANQMAPTAEAGKYMGLTNLATAGSAAVARLEGPMIDGFNNAAPGLLIGWTVLFAISAVLMVCSSLAMRNVPDTKVAAETKTV